ncbi:MAG: TrmB family transcriptional regulator, partial [Candidatus Hydrothermarchaeales archaeon]
MGPSKASEIARRLGINRMNAYRTLVKLRERGLVESTVGRPVIFSSTPLEKILDLLVRDAERRVQEMESNRELLLAEWSKISVKPTEVAEPKFRISQGRQQVYSQLSKTCESAKREIRIITTRNDLYRFFNAGIDDTLKSYVEKGVSIKIMTEIDKTGIEAA